MTVTAVRLAIALVVTLAMVLMTLRIGSSSGASALEVERNETESFVSRKWQFTRRFIVIGCRNGPSLARKIEYYLDFGTGATCTSAGCRRGCEPRYHARAEARAVRKVRGADKKFC
jgi:hypothetical protein